MSESTIINALRALTRRHTKRKETPTEMADRKWDSIPVAGERDTVGFLAQSLPVQSLPVGHTLIKGEAGTGKSAVLQRLLHHYLDAPIGEESFYDQGLVDFYLIDPKNTEFASYANAEFAKTVSDPETGEEWKVATTSKQTALTINAFHEKLMTRHARSGPPPQSDTPPTKQSPLSFLIMDQALLSYRSMDRDITDLQLEDILHLGRLHGMFIIWATSERDSKALNNDLFITTIELYRWAPPREMVLGKIAPSYEDLDTYPLMKFFTVSDDEVKRISEKYTPTESLI